MNWWWVNYSGEKGIWRWWRLERTKALLEYRLLKTLVKQSDPMLELPEQSENERTNQRRKIMAAIADI